MPNEFPGGSGDYAGSGGGGPGPGSGSWQWLNDAWHWLTDGPQINPDTRMPYGNNPLTGQPYPIVNGYTDPFTGQYVQYTGTTPPSFDYTGYFTPATGGATPDSQDRASSYIKGQQNYFLANTEDPRHPGYNLDGSKRSTDTTEGVPPGGPTFGGSGGGGGGASAYQQAQLAFEYQKQQDQVNYWNQLIADAKAKNDAQRSNDENAGIENFNKDYRDYQSKHFYGAQYGPGYFAPGGGATAYKAPEPYWVGQYFHDHPEMTDPFTQGQQLAGYSGSTYANAQHQGSQNLLGVAEGGYAPAAPVGSQGAAPVGTQHVQLGPELTGASGYGASVTADGTPAVMSMYQRSHLDPTSMSHYDDYLGSVAGFDPADFKHYSQQMGGDFNDLKTPTTFNGFAGSTNETG